MRGKTFWSVWRRSEWCEEMVRDGDESYEAASDAARVMNERGDGCVYELRCARVSSS